MTTDEIMLFDKWPNVLPLYAALRKTVFSLSGDDGKGGETQISFRNRHVFAMASPPWRRLRGAPENYLLVSFGLSHRSDSPRVWQSVEAYPGRWTHHAIVAREQIWTANCWRSSTRPYHFAMVNKGRLWRSAPPLIRSALGSAARVLFPRFGTCYNR